MAWRRWARLLGGGSLVVLGLVGWIVPVVPGWPLLLPGLALLATELPAAARLRDWLKNRIGRNTQERRDGN